jgi:hypothetical protein
MNNQQHDDRGMSEDPGLSQVSEASANPGPKLNRVKQRLEYDQARVRREPALLAKTEARNLVVFGVNFCFTRFHLRWPPDPDFFVSW